MRIYAYLRASTNEQDAQRARADLEAFAQAQGHTIAGWFAENESGATLDRPELFRLIELAQAGDVLLAEQVDRISRLRAEDWTKLKTTILAKGIHIAALDLPTSHRLLDRSGDEFTDRMLEAVNAMLLDMLAATARKDYEDRRRRQRQGIEAARAAGRLRGRQPNLQLHERIARRLRAGDSYTEITKDLGCSRATVAKVKKGLSA